MKKLVLKFKVNIVRYNFGDPFGSVNRIFDKRPTEKQLEYFLKEINEDDPHKDFDTSIHIEEFYQVINPT